VIEKYRLRDEVPRKVYDHLVEGKEGSIPEAPGKDDPLFDRVTNTIVGSNRQAIEAAGTRCGHLGIDAVKIDRPIRGEARDAGRWLVSEARRMLKGRKGTGKGLCLISGGETTVTVRGRGRGGRNMELALAAAIEMEGIEGMTLLSAGTDGTDGPTDAAGAIVDGRSIGRGREAGLDPGTCLSNNDSYRFLRGSGDLLVTGPTGTNVMDIQVMLLSA
jgi:glycerate-2-kinase